MSIRTPRKVKTCPDYTLCVTFDSGEKRIFDMKPYLTDKYFAPLKDVSKFERARINPITIEWDSGIDICPDELYYNSIPASRAP